MGEHSSLSLLHKVVRIISFLLLWQFGCCDTNISPIRQLPYKEAIALQNVVEALMFPLSITLSYCSDTKSDDSIKCDCKTSDNLCHIIEITINSKSLSGYITEDVSELESLEKLDLGSNQLYGTIPDSLGDLSKLTYLNLQGNKLIGSIPDSLGDLTNLNSLDLSSNKLSGSIPDSLGKLSKLNHLKLRANQLTGPIPENLKNLHSLKTLVLSQNFLTGKIPTSLGELSYLQNLYLSFNKLEGNIPSELGELTELQGLGLVENNLSGPLPDSLGNLRNLQYLWLTSNNFIEKLPEKFSQLTELLRFEVAGNSLSGSIPSYTKNWVKLTNMNLMGNNFEGSLPAEILSMTMLQYLLVSDLNNPGFSIPENANLINIVSLVLRNCSINGTIPSNIGTWTRLNYLDLSFNDLTGEIPMSLNQTRINKMYLTGNLLNGAVPDWINDKRLYKADLSYNDFTNGTWPPEAKKNKMDLAPNNSATVTFENITIAPNRGSILQKSHNYCQHGKSKYHSLFINSGGEEETIGKNRYEADKNLSNFYLSADKKNWAYTCSGDFVTLPTYNSSDYIRNLTCGVSVRDGALYNKARLCPVSLKYYGFCLQKGSYTVNLHFAEVVYTDDADYSSLGKRVFDVYVQGKRVLTDFNIKEKAGGPNKLWVENITTEVEKKHNNTLTIHLFWAGKGSIYNPPQLNGPLISAISVTPNFKIGGLSTVQISAITVASILAPLLLLALLWRMGLVGDRELRESTVQIQGKDYTVKQIIDAARKFSPKNEIGKNLFGIMYKAKLPNKQVVAVKKLYPKSMQQHGDQIRDEIANLKSLQQNDNVVQLLDGYSKKDLHLLIYEYMEHGSLEKTLFGPSPLELKWEARFEICKGIAKGLKHLHEARFKIIHGDVKTTNILIDGATTPKVKLSDFGLAKFHEDENPFLVTKERRNLAYLAPEYALQTPITVKADVYSFGVVLLQIVSRKPPEYKDNQETVFLLNKANDLHKKKRLEELVDRNLSFVDSKQAICVLELAMKCIHQFPDDRPEMSEIVEKLSEVEVTAATANIKV